MENMSLAQAHKKMPRLISDADFNKKLKMPSKNIAHTKQFIEEGVADYVLPGFAVQHGYRLVKPLKKDQYRLIATGDEPETVYLVELRFRKDIVFNKTTCTQIKVWRSTSIEHKGAVNDLPRTFFFNLLEQHNIVVTDEEQTGDGRRFWETMLSWAFGTGFHVYASDGPQMDSPLTAIANMREFHEEWGDFYWGEDPDVHTHRLVVISKALLSQ
ncbi:hypothetical protein BDD26_0818 [Xenorhabdus cabanillasii]|uniref:Phage protein n=2 Tax=Xenorhabdus cabanillasii TaxID=351673 RepID=A0A3D9UNC5_9GAMM|nr:hypothetical protein [Xenorhabdus cabanillasii]REF26211.1 hypothetical protein BDD26_0818 [Xenorhabdus cabanillasii]